MSLTLSDSLWFFTTTIVTIVWLTTCWIIHHASPQEIRQRFIRKTPALGLPYYMYGFVWFVLYALEIPGLTYLAQDVDRNYTYWLTGVICGLLNMVFNLLWVFAIFLHDHGMAAILCHLISLGTASVAMAMAYAMSDNKAGILLTFQVAFLLYAFVVLLMYVMCEEEGGRPVYAQGVSQEATCNATPGEFLGNVSKALSRATHPGGLSLAEPVKPLDSGSRFKLSAALREKMDRDD